MKDLAIIGGGPCGMTAAIYARRAGLSVLLFEKAACGGQMIYTPAIENYPGFARVSGVGLSESMQKQAEELGTEILFQTVTAVSARGDERDGFSLIAEGNEYTARALILAAGAARRRLSVPGEEQFIGRGVSYCAVCDGAFYKGKTVAVVGGGNTALEDALYLAENCERVYLIHRRERFRAQEAYARRVRTHPKITCMMHTSVTEIVGERRVESLSLCTGQENAKLAVSAVFIAVGLVPENGIFGDLVDLDADGYIRTDADMRTSHPGIFAAGDARDTPIKQIVTAAADGAIAATAAKKWLCENT